MTPAVLLQWALTIAVVFTLGRVLYDIARNPWRTLDLQSNGHPDHGKIIGLLFVVGVLVLRARGITFGVWELIVLAAAVFGSRMFLAFLKNRSANLGLTEQRTETVTTTASPALVTTKAVETVTPTAAAPPGEIGT